MKNSKLSRLALSLLCLSLLAVQQLSSPPPARAQSIPYARTFSKPKEDVEAALKESQAYAGQKLPVVYGFVAMGQQPLDRYERAFYQFSVEIIPETPQSTVVKLTAKITAWYADPDPAKAGYQALPSNGRPTTTLVVSSASIGVLSTTSCWAADAQPLGGRNRRAESAARTPGPAQTLAGAPWSLAQTEAVM